MITIEKVALLLQENKIELKSTQKKLCFPILLRMYKKMATGIKFSSIKVDGAHIIDGHHRYVASLLANVKLDIAPSLKTSATVEINWKNVELDANDWDTEVKINMLNEEDALYNEIDLEKIKALLK